MHLQSGDGVGQAFNLPLAPTVVTHVDPALIEGDDSTHFLPKGQELHGTLHSLDEAPVRVGIDGQLDDLPVAHVEALSHHPPNLDQRD